MSAPRTCTHRCAATQGNDEFTDAKEQGRGQDLATYDTSSEDDASDSGDGSESETSDIVERGASGGKAARKDVPAAKSARKSGGAPAAKRSKTAGGKMNVFRYVECDPRPTTPPL